MLVPVSGVPGIAITLTHSKKHVCLQQHLFILGSLHFEYRPDPCPFTRNDGLASEDSMWPKSETESMKALMPHLDCTPGWHFPSWQCEKNKMFKRLVRHLRSLSLLVLKQQQPNPDYWNASFSHPLNFCSTIGKTITSSHDWYFTWSIRWPKRGRGMKILCGGFLRGFEGFMIQKCYYDPGSPCTDLLPVDYLAAAELCTVMLQFQSALL